MRRLIAYVTIICVSGCGDSGGSGAGSEGGSGAGTQGGSGSGGSPAEGSIQCETEVCDECCNFGVCDTIENCDAVGDPIPVLYCDGPEDCDGGEACCGGLPAGSFPIVARCTTANDCMNSPEVFYLCHTDEDCGVVGTCSPWSEATYVSACD